MKNVLIPEDIPSHNKGEAALFYGIKESLKPMGPLKIYLFSLNPCEDEKNYGDAATIIDSNGFTPGHMLDGKGDTTRKIMNYLLFWGKLFTFLLLYKLFRSISFKFMTRNIWLLCYEADLVIMSHDSFYTPLYHCSLLLFFKILGKPVVIYGATITPPSSYESKLRAFIVNTINRMCLRTASMITVRENLSMSYLKDLEIDRCIKPLAVLPDLAFILPKVPEEAIDRIFMGEALPKDKPLIGIAISQRKLTFAFPELTSIQERSERALSHIVAMVDFITNNINATVVFIPHSIGPSSILDDRITADWIYGRAKHKGRIIIVRNEYSPQELKGMVSRLDMTIGTRLHFAIDAVSNGIPSLLITHKEDFRCHGIIGDMLGQKEYIYNIEQIDQTSLISMVMKLWEKRREVRKDLRARMPQIRELTFQHGRMVSELLK